MRRLMTVATTAALAAGLLVGAGAAPASASCPEGDGTVPQTPSRAFKVGKGSMAVYIDDRDFIDYDQDDRSGGLWIYMESNDRPGLQRGGGTYYFALLRAQGINSSVPVVNPIKTPAGPTLFPNGFGGGDLEETAGSHDDCIDKGPKDAILF